MPMIKRNTVKSMMVLTDHGNISFFLKRSPRRKTLEVQIKDDGQVHVCVPYGTSESDIECFLRQRALWIKQHSFRRIKQYERAVKRYEHGALFWFLGRQFPLHVTTFSKKRIQIEFTIDHWVVMLPKDIDDIEGRVKKKLWAWYEEQAKEVFGVRLFHYARLMKENPQSILIRKQKRIWGCCDKTRGIISLNWQLIQAPLHVIDYVIVHELAHLKHANHSARFWNRVAQFYPDYDQAKQWLKAHQVDITLH